jgi:anti-sigma regulatory factor (Ser/Thr protein kinase)
VPAVPEARGDRALLPDPGSDADADPDADPDAGPGLSAARVFRLAGAPEQVARARRLVSTFIGREHPLHDDCVLLTSELATNAVIHSHSGAGGAFTLTVSCAADRVQVCVQDDGSHSPPCVCGTDLHASGGRGLPLLEAIARRWGLIRESGANQVWFELGLDLVPNGHRPALPTARR